MLLIVFLVGVYLYKIRLEYLTGSYVSMLVEDKYLQNDNVCILVMTRNPTVYVFIIYKWFSNGDFLCVFIAYNQIYIVDCCHEMCLFLAYVCDNKFRYISSYVNGSLDVILYIVII